MPELPEVETVRRALAGTVPGRTIRRVRVSSHALRGASLRTIPARLSGRTIRSVGRTGKYLLFDLDGGRTLLSHLGMSGRWLFHPGAPEEQLRHEHIRIEFTDGSVLRFEDPRRFGLARVVATDRLARDPSVRVLGPDPVAAPPTGAGLHALARGARISVKEFLLDQRRIAGIGNIYASEILHRAHVHPRVAAGRVPAASWDAIAGEITAVLGEAIDRMGTTFQLYRTLWNEPGAYGERLLVYDRAGERCRICGGTVRRIVQGARSTFFCPGCQLRRPAPAGLPSLRKRAARPGRPALEPRSARLRPHSSRVREISRKS
jgi:formamidopyrimidine-DNA glycosylase